MISVQLWEAFRWGEVGERLVRAIQSLYEGCEARMKVWERYSQWFKVDQVVRHKVVLSCHGCSMEFWTHCESGLGKRGVQGRDETEKGECTCFALC